jgi:RimJ/RimL family protein N-acetyltransferase
MRFKDFGTPPIVELSNGSVLISTTTSEESKAIQILSQENKKFLDPWKTPMNTDSSETKIFTIKYEKEIVGQVILWNFQKNMFDDFSVKSCSVSYWLIQKYTNKGIATVAVEMICEYAFNNFDVDEIDATIQPENKPSIRVIEKLKFPHRKTVGDYKIFQGRWQGYVVYTIMKEPHDDVRV